jgi:hypothetical protein
MLSLRYNTANFAQVTDLADFYKGQEREISRIHSMVDSIKMLFHVPGNAIKIMVAEGERIYKILFYSTSLDKVPLGWFVYLPLEDRLDLYDTSLSTEMPYIQWKNKKTAFKNFAGLLDAVHVERLFDSVVKVS